MKIEASTIEEYFKKAGERELDLREADKLIRKYAPHCKPTLYQGMGGGAGLGYGMMSYQSRSMKTPGEWPIIGLANQKNYMAIYACAVIDGKYVAERYADRLGKVSVGKSCIRFKRFGDLDLTNLAEMLEGLDAHYQSGKLLFG
ncbi:DUF1801 domain-containing protein [Candidatus Saccharibacteria bacterium]|nr:DUF1801 domain-containing protein [Candidatus Saccharibacteria bacterium]